VNQVERLYFRGPALASESPALMLEVSARHSRVVYREVRSAMTRTRMPALREATETQGTFCAA
jgi:hypothetical protein